MDGDGALDANQRALRRAQEMIRGYEPAADGRGGRRSATGVHREARGGAA